MFIRKLLTQAINFGFVLTLALFLIDALIPHVEIKSQLLKHIIYFGVLITPLVSLIWHMVVTEKMLYWVIALTVIVGMVAADPFLIMISSESWSTQTVVYQHHRYTSYKVEFQMQDRGALGYNRRTVRVFYLTPAFMLVKPWDEELAGPDWELLAYHNL